MTETKGQIFELIPKIMRGIGSVGKNRRNAQQGYSFRGIDDFYNAVHPMLIESGVFIVPQVTERVREERQTKNGGTLIYTMLTVKHTFYAPDGSSLEAITVGEAMDSGDKSANKAMSAAMKYALIEVFCIPTEDDNDTENQTHEITPAKRPVTTPFAPTAKASADRVAEVYRLLKEKAVPESKVTEWLTKAQVDSFDDAKAETVEGIIKLCAKLPAPKAKKPAKADDYDAFIAKCESAAQDSGLSNEELFRALSTWMKKNNSDAAKLAGDAEGQANVLTLITSARGYFTPSNPKVLEGATA